MRYLVPAALAIFCLAVAIWAFFNGHLWVVFVAAAGAVYGGYGLGSETFKVDDYGTTPRG